MNNRRSRSLIIGVGGTGLEAVKRTRKKVEDKYGDTQQLPITGFLWIDTDQKEKISNPEAGGSPLKENEKCWTTVSSKDAEQMIRNLEQYPNINQWYPPELERNPNALVAGSGQIRAQGRFAFFCNYGKIRDAVVDACRRTKGHETMMQQQYQINVVPNTINIYIVGSFSGGTGSGMLLDLCYCIQHWLQGEATPIITTITPLPSIFAGNDVDNRIQTNAYAALMEWSYYSDYRTTYQARFSNSLTDEITTQSPPSNFCYLVDIKNGKKDFNGEQVRQLIAEQIFEEIDSEVGFEKRAQRNNMEASLAAIDSGGRGYPRSFMSFGRSTIEIPIIQIQNSLSYRLAGDICTWWLNEDIQLPPQMLELVRNDYLQPLGLTPSALLSNLSAALDRPYNAVISQWINELRGEINNQNLLECTQQGALGMFSAEKGKILTFLPFLSSKVDPYISEHFRELSPDEREHGDYFKKISDNRHNILSTAKKALKNQLYEIVGDRLRGAKFAEDFLIRVKQIFTDAMQVLGNQQKLLAKKETDDFQNYQNTLQNINEFKNKYGTTKQVQMEAYVDQALSNLESSLKAKIERKSRGSALIIFDKLLVYLDQLELDLQNWKQQLQRLRHDFQQQAIKQINNADSIFIDGTKLWARQEINQLYESLVKQYGDNQEEFAQAAQKLYLSLSQRILQESSHLWKEDRQSEEIMQLLDITKIPNLKQDLFAETIYQQAKQKVIKAPNISNFYQELAVGDRLLKIYPDDTQITEQIRSATDLAQPLVNLSPAVLAQQDIGFTPDSYKLVGIVGGSKTKDIAAQKLLPLLDPFYDSSKIKSLSDHERHKIVFYQEIGGFSLRCLEGLSLLRQAYLDWKGKWIMAKRAKLRGENQESPIPVHNCKQPPFWDLFPENLNIYKLQIIARALGVLRETINYESQENLIYYTRSTALGPEKVIIASSWEEVPQILEVKACQTDLESITKQVNKALEAAQTIEHKRWLFHQFTQYLEQRAEELENQGGKENTIYQREHQIILKLIEDYRLQIETASDILEASITSSNVATLPPESTNKSEPNLVEELEKIADLKTKGILTEAEFEQAKQQLLNRK